MTKAYYVDTFSYDTNHEMYNASSLKMFSCIYDEMVYCADITAKINLEKMLNGMPQNVKYLKINVLEGNSSIGRFFKQMMAVFHNCKFIIKANKCDTVIINYNTMIAIYPINWITKIFKKKVLVVCHGEMLDLTVERKTSWIFSQAKNFFKSPKTKVAKGLYFSVLGDTILNNLKPYLCSQVFNKMIPFEHSAIFDSYKLSQPKVNGKLKVGAIGIFRESKGLTPFLELAKSLKPFADKIEISAVGRIRGNKESFTDAGVKFYDEFCDRFLSREEMYQLISQLDLVLFLFPKEAYKVTASGSLFDAIDCERPILALENDYFTHIYNTCGSFGKLVDSYSDFRDELIELTRGDIYDIDFKSIKKYLTPESVAVELQKKLEKVRLA
jgi:hypothetical protein